MLKNNKIAFFSHHHSEHLTASYLIVYEAFLYRPARKISKNDNNPLSYYRFIIFKFLKL